MRVGASQLALFSNNTLTTHKYFFNQIFTDLLGDSPKLCPQTEFGIPPGTVMKSMAIGSGRYNFRVSFDELNLLFNYFAYI